MLQETCAPIVAVARWRGRCGLGDAAWMARGDASEHHDAPPLPCGAVDDAPPRPPGLRARLARTHGAGALRRVGGELLALVAPPACLACATGLAAAGELLCATCRRELPWLPAPRCGRC